MFFGDSKKVEKVLKVGKRVTVVSYPELSATLYIFVEAVQLGEVVDTVKVLTVPAPVISLEVVGLAKELESGGVGMRRVLWEFPEHGIPVSFWWRRFGRRSWCTW